MLSPTLHSLCKTDYEEGVENFLSALSSSLSGEGNASDNFTDDGNRVDMVASIINYRDELRNTPIHSAIFSRNVAALKSLVRHGADINIKCHGSPPLHIILTITALPGGSSFFDECKDVFIEHPGFNIFLKDDQNYTALHVAAGLGLHRELSTLLQACPESSRDSLVSQAPRISGLTALHRCVAGVLPSAAVVRVLLAACSDGGWSAALARNLYGQSSLHLAALKTAPDDDELLLTLLSAFGSPTEALKITETTTDIWGNSVSDLLAVQHMHIADDGSGQLRVRGNVLSKKGRTGIVTSPLCKRHLTCPVGEAHSPSAPPENIVRLEVLMDETDGVLLSSDLNGNPSSQEESPLALHLGGGAAPLTDVLRVHEWSYVRQVQERCDRLKAQGGHQLAFLDGDTAICADSFDAALHAAGSVCRAVDLVMSGKVRNAFCPIRPPGHHAGPRGVVRLPPSSGSEAEGPDSHGFCLLNNISIGAAYALNVHRDKVRRTAIVDFDVHHGNGTEETIRWLQPSVESVMVSNTVCFGQVHAPRYKPWFDANDAENVLFVSVHGYGPRERGLEHLMPLVAFYPGSGKTHLPRVHEDQLPREGDRGKSQPNAPGSEESTSVEKLADDGEDPESDKMQSNENESEGGGEDKSNDEDEDEDDDDDDYNEQQGDGDDEDDESQTLAGAPAADRPRSVAELLKLYSHTAFSGHAESPPLQIVDVGVSLPETPFEEAKDGKLAAEWAYRIQWRNYFRREIFPRLLKFKPDCLFLSAGFDAHKKDGINAGYIALVEDDFEWLTQQLCSLAEVVCDGRVVSALEGGYQLGGRCCSAFARSVKGHVQSLAAAARYAPSRPGFSLENCEREAEIEEQLVQKLLEKRVREVDLPLMAADTVEVAADLPIPPSAGASISALPTAEVVEEVATSKKRRRPQVDYAALDLELRKAQL